MGINGKTNDFLAALTKLVQESSLPVCNVRLCLETLRLQLMELERQAISKEAEQENQTNETKQEE
ncbi:MAG: hypothetical protein LUC30_07665 [Clostridiales bacterium]|nr:hypothetical protein [Clostridiales bacterium]